VVYILPVHFLHYGIEAIKKGQREAAFLHGKLKAMASEPSTIRNYKKRADELEERYTLQTFDINK
jgi:hypothetical protein